MSEKLFQQYDRLGRPTLRYIGVFILLNIGLAIAYSFWMWALFGREIPALPGQAILLAGLPYMMQAVDHFTRMLERRRQIDMGQVPGLSMPNPHGGPTAP